MRGALGTGLLVLTMTATLVVPGVSPGGVAGWVIGLGLQTAFAVPAWWLASRLLLNLRVGWRATFPGAVVSAAAQVATGVAAAIWLPRLIGRDASHYGVIGVAVALVSWLVVIAFVTVTGAWASRLLDERAGRTREDDAAAV